MKKTKITLILIAIFCSVTVFAENIYFYGNTAFGIHQFWEMQVQKDTSHEKTGDDRRVFANYLSGSFGLGAEMIIWDMGVKRGSRIYFKNGINMMFLAPTYFGHLPYYDFTNQVSTDIMQPFTNGINGGVLYTGVNLDFTLGGSFPKTNLLWGFGVVLNFTFPVFAPNFNLTRIMSDYPANQYSFFAEPFIMIGYDILIPDTDIKITPQLRTGITTNPLVSDFLLGDMLKNTTTNYYTRDYETNNPGQYSGFFIELSVSISFIAIEWRK